MKSKTSIFIVLGIVTLFSANSRANNETLKSKGFDMDKDLLLVQYDCKTDVDDLQSAAALVTLFADARYSKIKYHAVAGTYGIQKGLYVPPDELFHLTFNDNWTDAHKNSEEAIQRVKEIAKATLVNQGDIWIAEAGQSDFSAGLIKAIQTDLPDLNTKQRIHMVQHSDWNEEVTSPEDLEFVKNNTDYHKIPDGNVVGNGSPGFRSPVYTQWKNEIRNPKLMEIWQLAIDLSNKYNGKEGRYLNEAISAGGLDFSDFSEVCWILGLEDIKDTEHFFNLFDSMNDSLAADSTIISIFTKDEISDLSKLLSFFEGQIGHLTPESSISKLESYKWYFRYVHDAFELDTALFYIDRQKESGILSAINHETFMQIWDYSKNQTAKKFVQEQKFNDTIKAISLRAYSKYSRFLEMVSKTDSFIDDYYNDLINCGDLSPTMISRFVYYPEKLDVTDIRVRLIIAIHYLTLNYNIRSFK